MNKPILLAIIAYQRFVSPYKGFHCAFHAHTGRDTCSGYGYRVFARYGSVRGWRLLRRRFGACSEVAQLYRSRPATKALPRAIRQGGFVDCGGCELPAVGDACDFLGSVGDAFECCSSMGKHRDSHSGNGSCGGSGKKSSIKDWDLADWLNFLLIMAVIAGLLYLIWHFFVLK